MRSSSAESTHTTGSPATRRMSTPRPRQRGEPAQRGPRRVHMEGQPLTHEQGHHRGPAPCGRPVDLQPCRTRVTIQAPSGKRQVRRTRKSVAGRYYQLLSGDAAIGPYPQDKIHKIYGDRCWWCESGEWQPRHHLFTGIAIWAPQARRLWKDIEKACG